MKNRVQEIRWQKGWSQAQLARISNVSQAVISDIENKQIDPKASTILKLARALACTVEQLFFLN